MPMDHHDLAIAMPLAGSTGPQRAHSAISPPGRRAWEQGVWWSMKRWTSRGASVAAAATVNTPNRPPPLGSYS
jgi:hypothetical protein